MGENKYSSFETHIIATPMCDDNECDNAAVYEFTDIILSDPDKEFKNRHKKRVVLGRACDKHYKEIRAKYADA